MVWAIFSIGKTISAAWMLPLTHEESFFIMANMYKQNMGFEAEVRRVAEAVWNLEPGSCQPTFYPNDPVVREVDGIARLRDVTHLLMVTTSTKLVKAKEDIKKLNAAESLEKKNVPAVSKWFITQKQLDAQHIEHARKNNVTAITLDDFRRRFFDGRKYLTLREKAAFGSARNPHDNTINFGDDAYVELPILSKSSKANALQKNDNQAVEHLVRLAELEAAVDSSEIVVLVAPFGGGKSLTTREVFKHLAKKYREGKSNRIPVVLNLREHWGQDHCDEMLERHARSVGYSPKEDLVIAWRAGMISLLLDGFDEVASQAVIRKDDKNFMREARRIALGGVRDFLTKVPSGVGVWLCGRDHYFDNDQELAHSLGLAGKTYKVVRLDEFNEEGANDFLRRNGVEHDLPDWLPRKPLLLGYLTQHGLFDDVLAIDSSQGFGFAWDNFLTKIAERESVLEHAVMDPETVRGVLERLAFMVRARSSGSGPITGNDLSEAYSEETGQAAGEGVLAQLQRLPGLTQREQDPGSRSFVDEDMLAALQGSAFANILLGRYRGESTNPVAELSMKAIAMAYYMLAKNGANTQTVVSVVEQLSNENNRGQSNSQMIADGVAVALNGAIEEGLGEIDFRGLIVNGAVLGEINVDDLAVDGLQLRNCVVGNLILGKAGSSGDLRVSDSIISKLSGVSDKAGIPENIISGDCDVEEFDNMTTNSAVLSMDIPPQLKALLTVLRKLYRQAGAGRKLSALKRGLTQQDVLSYVDPVLDLLESESLVAVFNKVVHPVRRQTSRVDKILSAPMLCNDHIVNEVLGL